MINMKSGDMKKPTVRIIIMFTLVIFILLAGFSGCSSAPKRPAEDFTIRNMASNQLNFAEKAANQGRFEDALLFLDEARRLTLSTDDPALRIRTSICNGNYLFSLGRETEAFQSLEAAAAEADASGQGNLAALARIYAIRAKLVLLSNTGKDADAAAQELKTRLVKEQAAIKSDPLTSAAGHVTMGFAERQLRRWAEAESAVKQGLEIHEKNRYLEDAAYDWFLIASIRSQAGNYSAALEALNKAIHFDRRAENGFGLASSWQAMGDVYKKAGKAEESQKAYNRAAEIFEAIGKQ